MSREIKFRGKRIGNGEWVEGDLTRYSKYMSYITVDLVEGEVYEVLTPTVGQYTGLHDKNGTEIYEGDIVGYRHMRAKIIFGFCGFELEWIDGNTDKIRQVKSEEIFHNISIIFKIIGNIHDNPELIGGDAP